MSGADEDLMVRTRAALLDALEALEEQRNSVVVIGAQAIYLHTGSAEVAIAESTKDADLGVDTRSLADAPLIEVAMEEAGFYLNPGSQDPGAWMTPAGIPVDLMVPEAIAGGRGRRSVNAPPHSRRSMRRAVGLEAAVVDHSPMMISSLSSDDARRLTAEVAAPAALLVAKLHKIAERQKHPTRLANKDAHDVYRLLTAIPTPDLCAALQRLMDDPLAGNVTEQALTYLRDLFAVGAIAPGSQMAGHAEEGVGDPEIVAASSSVLAADLIRALGIVEKRAGGSEP